MDLDSWIFTPTIKKGVAGKINGSAAQYGWYDRKINEVRCIICFQDFWSYVTIDGNMELHSKDLVVDSKNKCLNKPLNEEEIKVLIY